MNATLEITCESNNQDYAITYIVNGTAKWSVGVVGHSAVDTAVNHLDLAEGENLHIRYIPA